MTSNSAMVGVLLWGCGVMSVARVRAGGGPRAGVEPASWRFEATCSFPLSYRGLGSGLVLVGISVLRPLLFSVEGGCSGPNTRLGMTTSQLSDLRSLW